MVEIGKLSCLLSQPGGDKSEIMPLLPLLLAFTFRTSDSPLLENKAHFCITEVGGKE